MSAAIAMTDFAALWHEAGAEVLKAVERTGKSGWWILGKEVAAFETALAAWWGLPHAIGCASGLDAIEIGLRAAGLKPGERVLTTPLSAFATTLAILRAGGVPVFVDVDASGLLDLDLADAALHAHNEIHFCVPVHLYGHALNLAKLKTIAHRHRLHVIEDCAQAIGAQSQGKAVGSVGDFAATSFYPTKNLGAMGDAGALLCRTELRDALARQYRDYGQSEKFVHDVPGLNSRLDEMQAAILSALLPHLKKHTARRTEIADYYRAHLDHKLIKILPAPEGSQSVWHLFPVIVKEKRGSLQAHLARQQIASAVHYPLPIPRQKALAHTGTQLLTPISQAEYLCEHVLSLPLHPFMSDADMQRVVEQCNRWSA